MLINKINKCQPNTFINHSFQNEGNYVKIYDYLMYWRSRYWNKKDMSDFLCGMIGNIRKNHDKIVKSAILNVADKTNDDVSHLVEGYLKGGVKSRKKQQKRLKTRRIKTRKN